MKCPKCKKGKLGTARTFGESERVRRERVCQSGKCGHRFWTIELSESDYRQLHADLNEARDQRTIEQYALEQTVREYERAAAVFVEAAQKHGKRK